VRFAFDTGVLISALLFPVGKPRQAFDQARALGSVLISIPLHAEIDAVTRRRKFLKYFSASQRQAFMDALLDEAEWVPITRAIQACRDPKDNMVLELAVSGGADFIVASDPDLLVLDPFGGIRVVTPEGLLEILRNRST
jgi:putative PIN family toxin of toxin-antitoxin system